MTSSNIIVALDFQTESQVFNFLDQITPELCRVKIGKELFTRFGPSLVTAIQQRGYDIFCDLKFHDIPNTTAAACRAAASLGVWMVNVHISGGRTMLQAARRAIDETPGKKPLLIGVTVLTSLTAEDLGELGMTPNLEELVLRYAQLAADCGLDGIVCSAREAALLRQHLPGHFLLVTPGIRFTDSPSDDQQRTLTPEAALKAGANYLVIGRPITGAENPRNVLETLNGIG
jgi:orotidine-5'-phosphate decarboxylase